MIFTAMESTILPNSLVELPPFLYPVVQTLQRHQIFKYLQPSSEADALAVIFFLISAVGYITHGRIWDKPDPYYKIYFERPQCALDTSSARSHVSRDIAERLEEGNYQVVIFWGSQSGTAERFAGSLGQECSTRFGINALVADLSDYDAESIARIQNTHFAIFILSTYGEGDPSDNATGLWDWIRRDKQNLKLGNLRYLALGLGNSNYKYYNRVLDEVVETFQGAGATELMAPHRADDALGETEEDFQAWKEDLFALFRGMGYEQKSAVYQPGISVEFGGKNDSVQATSHSYTSHLPSTTNSDIFPLPVRNSRELFSSGDRNCIHMELDLGAHDIVYKAGDHIGIWPSNPDEEVERLLESLGLAHRRNDALEVTQIDGNTKLKAPSGTTLEAVLRHHLEICAPVSRKTIEELAQFAPTASAKAMLEEIGNDRVKYEQLTSNTHITFARLLQLASPSNTWDSLPLSFLLEKLFSLQPRYYSISSTPVISPRRVAITALVVNKAIGNGEQSSIAGLTSNYLLSVSQLPSQASVPTPSFQLESPDRVYAHIRKSKFKLPVTSSTPLVLIAAGTGFAPFRAFLSERAKLHAIGKPIGKMVLFFGCRHPDLDYIYRDELSTLQQSLGDKLEIVTAFSREGPKKWYVQDRVAEHATRVLDMLNGGANLYICGKASMAREVDGRIEEAVKMDKGLSDSEVKSWMDGLKKRGKWRSDVWG